MPTIEELRLKLRNEGVSTEIKKFRIPFPKRVVDEFKELQIRKKTTVRLESGGMIYVMFTKDSNLIYISYEGTECDFWDKLITKQDFIKICVKKKVCECGFRPYEGRLPVKALNQSEELAMEVLEDTVIVIRPLNEFPAKFVPKHHRERTK
jgi:hypothetical protein